MAFKLDANGDGNITMADAKIIASSKVFGLPVWLVILSAAAGIWYFFPNLFGGKRRKRY